MKTTAEDLVALIRRRYPLEPGGYQRHVVLEQVADGTGMHHSRWIDVVVFDLWPSKGLTRSAFEIKVSRGDFLREISNPAKHQWVIESFHEFWFVAPLDVIKIEELPPNAGWLFPRSGKLAIKKRAIWNKEPKLDDVLLAAFMRAAAKEVARVTTANTQDVLDNNKDYQQGQLYLKAVSSFLTRRGLHKYEPPANQEELLAWLEEATMDNELKEDRDHLLAIAARFQREIASLSKIFLMIANKSLLARNELGKHIVQRYGGDDSQAVETLKEYAKGKKISIEKGYVDLIELLLNWDRQFHVAD